MARRKGGKKTEVLWIICEGETEHYYFQKLKFEERIKRVNICTTKKSNALGIVDYAINFAKFDRSFKKGDRIFCIFDRDTNSSEQLHNASLNAKTNGIEIIFSNPQFEIWLLLHYTFFSQSCEKDVILNRLRKHLPNYHKADPNIYLKTREKISTAAQNSQKLIEMHLKKEVDLVSRDSNPVTLVNRLINVITLLKKSNKFD